MKKTINIAIGGLNFQIEEEAYASLEKYLADIKARFAAYADASEIISDIEDRIAEHFSGKIKTGQAIDPQLVQDLVAVMGRPEQIDESEKTPPARPEEPAAKAPAPAKRLFRNMDDAILGGVCSGIAAYLGIDTVWVRLVFALSVLFGGFGAVLYIILWVIVPPAETDTEKLQMRGDPINLKNLEQTVKDRVSEIKKKDPGQLKRGLAAPLRALQAAALALGRFIQRLLPVVFRVLGVAITLAGALAMAALIFLAVSLLTNTHSPYLDFPFKEIASGSTYYLALGSGFVSVLVPVIFVILLGTSLAAYRSTFGKMGSFMLLGLWVAALAVFANMAIKLAPQAEDLLKNSPYYQTVEKEYALKDFSGLELGGVDEAVLYPGSAYRVVAEAKEKDLSRAELAVQNGVLKIKREQRFRLCLFCAQDKLKLSIYAPELRSLDLSGASQAVAGKPLSGKNLKLQLSGVASFEGESAGQALTLNISGASKASLRGDAGGLSAAVSGASKLDAGGLKAKSVDLDLSGASKAYFGDVGSLKIQASGASTVYYHSAETLQESYSGAARAIKALGDAARLPEPDQNQPLAPPSLAAPLDRATERASKKPFGVMVSPQSSPVSPEKFSGFHTGVDFEIFPEEQDSEVAVKAICEGQVLQKRTVSGYGGVLVQSCQVEGRDVTVIYGHLRLASIGPALGQKLAVGEILGYLGKANSQETGGERKHLHLGIHSGKDINLAGYVKTQAELKAWLDPEKYWQ